MGVAAVPIYQSSREFFFAAGRTEEILNRAADAKRSVRERGFF
jgi:hypothetical protein